MEEVARTEEPDRKPTCSIMLPKQVQLPEGFADIGVDKDISLSVTGKVRSVTRYEYDDDFRMELEITGVSLESDGETITLADAVKNSQKTV